MLLVVGVVGVLTSARTTGIDTVVDTAMIDGANHLYSMMHGFSAMGMWRHDARGRNLLDSGTPFYDVYPTADDRYVSVACIEPAVFADFLGTLGIEDQLPEPLSEIDHWQPRHWSIMRRVFAEALASRTLAELEDRSPQLTPRPLLHRRSRNRSAHTGTEVRPGNRAHLS
ncbi:CoA-transferase family III [Brevibacterium antiquum CNRZ 918]|uniref:CoA-transferase family III n=1 Tax=Brevibacterium antiquum CNRZ 918 TaxID=1255637 RepID=A0A2H1IEH0_9MICO|nr:CoA-transferase family III [Brevibacterium antiquum CNRZ 918]